MSTNTPAAQFDFNEVCDHCIFHVPSVLMLLESLSSVSSVHSHEGEVPPLDPSPVILQPSNVLPVTSPPEMHPEENPVTPKSSHGILMLKEWLQTRTRKRNNGPTSHKPDHVPETSRQPLSRQDRSSSPPRASTTNEGPSRIAATRRVPVSAPPR